MPGENRLRQKHFIIKCFLAWWKRATRFKVQNASSSMIPDGKAAQSTTEFKEKWCG
jgi:hypothetical protein